MPIQGQQQKRAGFFIFALHIWTVFALAASNIFLGLSVLLLPWAGRGWIRTLRRSAHLLFPLTLYALFLGVSVLLSVEPELSRWEIKELFSLGTLPLAFAWVGSERRVRQVRDGLVAVVAGTAVWGLAQLLMGYGQLAQRIRGPFSHYMTFSGVLLLADLVLCADLACSGEARRQPWKWLALAVINAALVGTLTRSAWVALLVAIGVMALVHAPRALMVLAPALLLGLLFAPAAVQQRFVSIFDIRDVTNYDRLCMVEAGLEMIKERPFFGLGPDTVRERYPIYRQPTAPRRSVKHLHNSFVHLAAERGLTSLLAYLWLMTGALVLAFRGYRGARTPKPHRAGLYLGAFLALLAFNVAGLFEANWRDTELQRLALFLIAVPYLVHLGESEGTTPAVRE